MYAFARRPRGSEAPSALALRRIKPPAPATTIQNERNESMSAAANDHFPHPGVSHQPDHPANYGITQTTSPAVTASGSAVEQAHGAIVHAKNEFQKHINAVERDRHQYSPDGFHSHVAGFASTDAAKAVDAAVSQVQERVKTAADQVDRMRSDLSPQGDVGAEMRAGRQWSRTQRILDSTANAKLFGIAQKIVTGADRAELGVLLEELPPYFESRGQRSDWLDTAVGQVAP